MDDQKLNLLLPRYYLAGNSVGVPGVTLGRGYTCGKQAKTCKCATIVNRECNTVTVAFKADKLMHST